MTDFFFLKFYLLQFVESMIHSKCSHTLKVCKRSKHEFSKKDKQDKHSNKYYSSEQQPSVLINSSHFLQLLCGDFNTEYCT